MKFKNEAEERVYKMMLKYDVNLETILDVIIKSNHLVGVGVVSLQDRIDDYFKEYWMIRGRKFK